MNVIWRRVLGVVALLTILMMTLGAPIVAFAASYSANFVVVDNTSTSYTMLPVMRTAPISWMISNGFITNANALDTRISTLGGVALPHMVTTTTLLTAMPVPANSQVTSIFSTGNSALTNFDILAGYGGYVTTADAAALELSNNYAVDFDGYFKTSTAGNILVKTSALTITTTGTSIKAENPTADTKNTTGAAQTGTSGALGGVWWYAQTILTTSAYSLVSVNFATMTQVGAPGTLTMGIYAVDAGTGKPTGAALATVAKVAGGGPYSSATLATPLALATATKYAVMFSAPAGNIGGGNYWGYNNDPDDCYANGIQWRSGDSGATWAAAEKDMLVSLLSIITTEYTCAPGAYALRVSENTTHMAMYVDSSGTAPGTTLRSTDTSTTGIPNNANAWVLMSNVNPYNKFIKFTVAGTLKLHYQPTTLISGTNLPNRAVTPVTDNGTFTWGAMPASVTVTLSALGTSSASSTTAEDTARDVLGDVNASDWFQDPDLVALSTNPFRPFVTILSISGMMSELQAWRFLGLVLVISVLILTAVSVKGHLLIAGIAGSATIGMLVAMSVWPLWTLVFIIPAVVGGLVSERTPSL